MERRIRQRIVGMAIFVSAVLILAPPGLAAGPDDVAVIHDHGEATQAKLVAR